MANIKYKHNKHLLVEHIFHLTVQNGDVSNGYQKAQKPER